MQGPIRGCLFESEIRRHGDTLNFDDFAGLAIEGEMAVRIASDGTIPAAFPVIELHHFVFRGPTKTLPELVANNGLNGGFVLPYDGWLSSRKCIEGKDALSVRSTVALSPPASYGRCLAALPLRFIGFGITWRIRATGTGLSMGASPPRRSP
jgi:hypothetical protein